MKYQNLFFFIAIIFISCNEHTTEKNKPAVTKIEKPKFIQQKLDSFSHYQVMLPENYQINGSHSIDITDYEITPADSSTNNIGTAKIFLAPYTEKPFSNPNRKLLKDSTMIGKLLGEDAEWKIFVYDNYMTAETGVCPGNGHCVGVSAKAKTYSALDSMINILCSLKRL